MPWRLRPRAWASPLPAQKIIRENFCKKAIQVSHKGVYAIHLWPDDLPGGGWCYCPLCRSFGPSDQAMLAMRNLAEVVRKKKLPLRVPMIAYHDTMQPSGNIPPSKENFLLFAPRERCYGHRLDDPRCARNRFYLATLVGWMEKFRGINDAHTFEYYFDQILFRGIYPYLPDVIADDMRVYERHGIETHMALQIAGPTVAPEWNILFFARHLWDRKLSPQRFNAAHAASLGGSTAWRAYLDRRAGCFTPAMRMCDHEIDVYLDYRWLPENTSPFGREMARTYRQSSGELTRAASKLAQAISVKSSKRLRNLTVAEVARARFEAAELKVMAHQQEAVNQAARYLAGNDRVALRAAIAAGQGALRAFRTAHALARKAGLSEKSWYCQNINRWIAQEMKRKIKAWQRGLA